MLYNLCVVVVLAWVSPKTELETKACMHVVIWELDLESRSEGSRKVKHGRGKPI